METIKDNCDTCRYELGPFAVALVMDLCFMLWPSTSENRNYSRLILTIEFILSYLYTLESLEQLESPQVARRQNEMTRGNDY